MNGLSIGLLHPGDMGSTIGAAAVSTGHKVHWAAAGRSPATRQRADQAGLISVNTLADICDVADVIISVCPPHGAVALATQVAACGFSGQYLDANAISPARSEEVHKALGNDIDYIDGGIIGPPPTEAGLARLYLAGGDAATVAALWEGSNLDARVLDGDVGSASAFKVAYAGWTKGSTALLLAIRAYAEANGLDEEIVAEWEISIPGLADRAEDTAGRIGRKAWRFEGEMAEIAAAMGSVGLPEGFHDAAREVYHRLSDLKGVERASIDDVNRRLLGEGDR
jgi:3-hydroxyisobutyrate dehydrogenase-like beta-hydroxyacid dehydrogenase